MLRKVRRGLFTYESPRENVASRVRTALRRPVPAACRGASSPSALLARIHAAVLRCADRRLIFARIQEWTQEQLWRVVVHSYSHPASRAKLRSHMYQVAGCRMLVYPPHRHHASGETRPHIQASLGTCLPICRDRVVDHQSGRWKMVDGNVSS